MSRLFAFNNAEEMIVSDTSAGRYDAAQQLWVVDEASFAAEPEVAMSKKLVGTVTFERDSADADVSFEIDF